MITDNRHEDPLHDHIIKMAHPRTDDSIPWLHTAISSGTLSPSILLYQEHVQVGQEVVVRIPHNGLMYPFLP